MTLFHFLEGIIQISEPQTPSRSWQLQRTHLKKGIWLLFFSSSFFCLFAPQKMTSARSLKHTWKRSWYGYCSFELPPACSWNTPSEASNDSNDSNNAANGSRQQAAASCWRGREAQDGRLLMTVAPRSDTHVMIFVHVCLRLLRWSFSGGQTGKKMKKEKPDSFFKTRPLELSASIRCLWFKNLNNITLPACLFCT